MLLEEGYSTKYVAERLGDREDTITRTYAHATSKSRRRAVETISALLDEPATGEDAIPSLSRKPKKRRSRSGSSSNCGRGAGI